MILFAPLVTRDASGALRCLDVACHLVSMDTSVALHRVRPDLGAMAGTSDLREIVGALLAYGLLVSVTMLIISAITWAIASNTGSWQGASRAKSGMLVALGGAVLTGGTLAWANWLIDVGARL